MANSEHFEILKKGVEIWNNWRRSNPDLIPNLQDADLRSVTLISINLEGANLMNTNLMGADLKGANLIDANLKGANLVGSNLTPSHIKRADLVGANLMGVSLKGAFLLSVNLEGVNLSNAEMTNIILSEANLKSAILRDANLEGAILRDVNLEGANLEGANLEDANLEGANLEDANLKRAKLGGANLKGANLKGANLEGANLESANLERVILMKANLYARSSSLGDLVTLGKDFTYSWSGQIDSPLLQFDSIFPLPFRPNTWQDLLVYVYLEDAIQKVLSDFDRRKQSLAGTYSGSKATSQSRIPHDSLLTIVPNILSVVCNPPSQQFRMTEDYHCLPFRIKHHPTPLVERLGRGKINGTINIYLETLLIGEIPVHSEWEAPDLTPVTNSLLVGFTPQSETANTKGQEFTRQTATQFRKIFVSYSHKDTAIIERLEKAYRALGDNYWRDFQSLRSGEVWSEAIEKAIHDSNVFQLCWSQDAKASPFVEREWRAALKRELPDFIRPLYWEKPMPEPPSELEHLHFAHYDLG